MQTQRRGINSYEKNAQNARHSSMQRTGDTGTTWSDVSNLQAKGECLQLYTCFLRLKGNFSEKLKVAAKNIEKSKGRCIKTHNNILNVNILFKSKLESIFISLSFKGSCLIYNTFEIMLLSLSHFHIEALS